MTEPRSAICTRRSACSSAFHRLRLGDAADGEHLGDLLADPDRRVQRGSRVLVDHRDGIGAQCEQLVARHREHVATVDPDVAAADAPVARQVLDDRPARRSTFRSLTRRRARMPRRGGPRASPRGEPAGPGRVRDTRHRGRAARARRRAARARWSRAARSSVEHLLQAVGDEIDADDQARDRETGEEDRPLVCARVQQLVVVRDLQRPVG